MPVYNPSSGGSDVNRRALVWFDDFSSNRLASDYISSGTPAIVGGRLRASIIATEALLVVKGTLLKAQDWESSIKFATGSGYAAAGAGEELRAYTVLDPVTSIVNNRMFFRPNMGASNTPAAIQDVSGVQTSAFDVTNGGGAVVASGTYWLRTVRHGQSVYQALYSSDPALNPNSQPLQTAWTKATWTSSTTFQFSPMSPGLSITAAALADLEVIEFKVWV